MAEVFARMVSLAMISIFTQNAIFDRAFGINVAIYASRKTSHIIGFTVAITLMTTFASAAAYPFDLMLLPSENGYLYMPLIYVGIVGVLYLLGLFALWGFFPKTYYKVNKYAHLAIFNCTVFGALFLNYNFGKGFAGYVGYGFGTGIGFFLACFLLNIAHERLNNDKIPRAFRGYPIMLVFIGIISLAFNVLVGYTAEF
ncbi:MAG: hypothetical protein J1F28_06455 [Oscillospiraceae bacterium]|nr:hypothetical protein [Oscillospiraceae bacterium]